VVAGSGAGVTGTAKEAAAPPPPLQGAPAAAPGRRSQQTHRNLPDEDKAASVP
jgi:hypothetical protein